MLRDPCALTLGDEPLASGVEHGPVQLRIEAAQVGIPLHHFIDSEMREQPASLRQSRIQQLLKDTMQRHLPLCCLGLQQAHRIGLDADKPSQVPLAVTSSAMSPQISPERMPVRSPKSSALCSTLSLAPNKMLTCSSFSTPMGMNLWPVFDLEGLPGVGSQLPLTNTPVKELGHLLEDTSLGLGCQSDTLERLTGLLAQPIQRPSPPCTCGRWERAG